MGDDFLRALIGFFAIVDPVGNVLVFEAVAGQLSTRDQVRTAALAVVVSFGLIALFAVAGQSVLDLLSISQPSFQIAAGVLLVLPAIRLVEQGELFDKADQPGESTIDAAIVPLALPMLSGPGALALAISSSQQAGTGLTILAAGLVLAGTFVVFASTALLVRVVPSTMLRAFARIMGVVLMAIAVDFIVSGWVEATR
ncbi:MAG: MarC family protein [Hyphomicrobiales bacterium]